MKAEDYRQKRAEEPKGKGRLSKRKSQMLATSQERNPITSPQLREDYSSKTEWARKIIPKLKEEAPEVKEELG
jgi:predicted HTH transcriptional regulator